MAIELFWTDTFSPVFFCIFLVYEEQTKRSVGIIIGSVADSLVWDEAEEEED